MEKEKLSGHHQIMSIGTGPQANIKMIEKI
jgi:hypothetical protein